MANDEYAYCGRVTPGEANAEGELSLPVLVTKIIDVATDHANSLHIGNPDMADLGCGWVLVRFSIEARRYPEIYENYTLATWIESMNRRFSTRVFELRGGDGSPIGWCRSIWMAMNYATRESHDLRMLNLDASEIKGAPVPISLQAKHQIILPPGAADEPGKLIANYPVVTHRYGYSDVDFYRHVNTVRHVALILDQFSLKDHDDKRVDRFEISFMHETPPASLVNILRCSDPASPEVTAFSIVPDGNPASPLLFSRVRMVSRQQQAKAE